MVVTFQLPAFSFVYLVPQASGVIIPCAMNFVILLSFNSL
jgi:hypothetical protein